MERACSGPRQRIIGDVFNIVLDMIYVLIASFVNIIISPADYAS